MKPSLRETIDFAKSERARELVEELSSGIGDVNSDAKGSGARYNKGKPNYALIPLCTLEAEVRVWEYGEKKYSAFNWLKGMPWSVPFACMMRHLAAWQKGETIDPESGESHMAHVLCNARMLMAYESVYPEGDDRPSSLLKDHP